MTPEELAKKLAEEAEARKAAEAAVAARQAEVEQARAAAKAAEDKLAAHQAEVAAEIERRRIEALPEQQRQQEQARLQQEQTRLQIADLQQQVQIQHQQARNYFLSAYTAQRLREVGNKLILSRVGGTTEAEIDASIQAAQQEYATIEQLIRADVSAQHAQQVTHSLATAVQAPPQNPNFVAPPGTGLPDAPQGAPTGHSYQPPQQSAAPQLAFPPGMSIEEAVRQGYYTPANRDAFIRQATGQTPTQQTGRMLPPQRPLQTQQPQQPYRGTQPGYPSQQVPVPGQQRYPQLPPPMPVQLPQPGQQQWQPPLPPPTPPNYQPQYQNQAPNGYAPQQQAQPQQQFSPQDFRLPAQPQVEQQQQHYPQQPAAQHFGHPQPTQFSNTQYGQPADIGGVPIPEGTPPELVQQIRESLSRTHAGGNALLASRSMGGASGNKAIADINKFAQQQGFADPTAAAHAYAQQYYSNSPDVLGDIRFSHQRPRPCGARRFSRWLLR